MTSRSRFPLRPSATPEAAGEPDRSVTARASGGWTWCEGDEFSLLVASGFAPAHRHAFVVRGASRRPLFRPGQVPSEALCSAAGLAGARLHLPLQVHGPRAAWVPRDRRRSPAAAPGDDLPIQADALATGRPGHAVGIATADCLPILIAGSEGRCAAVHAGWRGLLAGVVESTVALLADGGPIGMPAVPAAGFEATIGPAIGPCCFEVGAEVAALFEHRFAGGERSLLRAAGGGKAYVDLPAAGAALLERAGIAPAATRLAELCTRCGSRILESYRRDGPGAGRMIALIGPLGLQDGRAR